MKATEDLGEQQDQLAGESLCSYPTEHTRGYGWQACGNARTTTLSLAKLEL